MRNDAALFAWIVAVAFALVGITFNQYASQLERDLAAARDSIPAPAVDACRIVGEHRTPAGERLVVSICPDSVG